MRPWILVLLFCSIFAFEERVTVPNSLSNTKCPPAGFDSVKDFDPKSFIRKSWFIQEQVSSFVMSPRGTTTRLGRSGLPPSRYILLCGRYLRTCESREHFGIQPCPKGRF